MQQEVGHEEEIQQAAPGQGLGVSHLLRMSLISSSASNSITNHNAKRRPSKGQFSNAKLAKPISIPRANFKRQSYNRAKMSVPPDPREFSLMKQSKNLNRRGQAYGFVNFVILKMKSQLIFKSPRKKIPVIIQAVRRKTTTKVKKKAIR